MFLIDWLFPIKCYGCNQTGQYLCLDCKKKLDLLKQQAHSVYNYKETVQAQKNSVIKKSFSLYPYKPPLNQMLKDYKYHQVRGLKKVLVELLEKGLRKNKLITYWRRKEFVFVPVPLYPLKELSRGFNQCQELLTSACQELGLSYQTDLVERIKWTKSQTKLSLPARKENLNQAFKVNVKKITSNMNLVIFDDVMTTGSTLLSCAQAFKKTRVNTIHSLTMFVRL